MKNSINMNRKVLSINFNKNLEVIKNKDINLYDKIVNYQSTDRYTLHPNSDGKTYNVFDRVNDTYIYDSKEPLYQIKKETDKLDLKGARVPLFLGFGLGYQFIYYLDEFLEKNKMQGVIIVEKDLELFIMALYAFDHSQAFSNKNCILLIDEDLEWLDVKFNELFQKTEFMLNIKSIATVYQNTIFQLDSQYYMSCLKSFREALVHVYNFVGNSPEDSLLGLKNMFLNLNSIMKYPGINKYWNGPFVGKPAVLVASGPSLKKNMHLINSIKDKALIICAESTIKILLENGIRPHMVTSLERDERQISFAKFSEEELSETYYMTTPVIPKSLYDAYDGKKIVVYRQFDHFKWLDLDKGTLKIKESSANMSFKVADSLGCNPIILLGQDLAFDDKTEATHIEGHLYGDNQSNYKQSTFFVKGNYKEKVKTTELWYRFLSSFKIDISESTSTCINASEAGAYIEGTKIDTFQNVINEYLTEDIYPLNLLDNLYREYDYPPNYNQHIKDKLEQSLIDMQYIMDNCRTGFDEIIRIKPHYLEIINNKKFTKTNLKEAEKEYDKIIELRNNFNTRPETFQLLVMHVIQPIFIKIEIDINEIPKKYDSFQQALFEITLSYERIFQAIYQISQLIKDVLIKTQEQLKSEGRYNA